MLKLLSKTPFISRFLDTFSKEKSLLFENVSSSIKATLCSCIKKHQNKNIIIILGSEKENFLYEDLLFFDPSISKFPSISPLLEEDATTNPDILGKRLEIMHGLATSKKPKILIAPLQTLFEKHTSKELLKKECLTINVGFNASFANFPSRLDKLGYVRKAVAADKGEYAIRGGIIDVFPISSFDPYRLDFFGDTIDQIRTYDPISQKSIQKVKNFTLTPATQDQSPETNTLIDFFQEEPILIIDDLLDFEDKLSNLKSTLSKRGNHFFSIEEVFEKIDSLQTLYFTKTSVESLYEDTTKKKSSGSYNSKDPFQEISFSIFEKKINTKRCFHPFRAISTLLQEGNTNLLEAATNLPNLEMLFFICTSDAEEKKLSPSPQPSIQIEKGYLSGGFILDNIVVFPSSELTKKHRIEREKWRNSYHTPSSDFHELNVGDLVVHYHNGIGKFLGLEKTKNHLGQESEFLVIEYANHSKLYTPLSQSHLVSRYIGAAEENPTLHTLGTNKWHKTKQSVEKAIIGYARDLLHFQALRETKGGFAYPEDSIDMQLFEEEFPYVETVDQLSAIQELKQDMYSSQGMDRLICGDVGYGKTEVAMRAAFKAVIDGGKQVAVLVPTTILAMQHYETFCNRMSSFPVNIGVLSRFVSSKEIKKTVEGMKDGSFDIVIGTHRIISKDISFHNLGLIIIDEEQRFGVRAKEHLKKMKIGVDCLTLSATPIPRTLYFSLVGAKDMSVINSPPQDRLPIKTIIAERDTGIIKHALQRELSQDGQAYFIHNRVETIFGVAKELEDLMPGANIGVVHGQMNASAIDSIFHRFKLGEIDILVATTIIESGVDIPNANTIFVDRSDTFGLSDLYQIRGRVGRWNKPAFAYFLIPKNRSMQELSRKRLQALVATSGFGGGMKLAMKDLEIRGAGDILGVKQSGNVSSIGFHLYCKLLKQTIAKLQKKIPLSFVETKMEFSYNAKIPEFYISDTSLRIEIYHRLGEILEEKDLDSLIKELEDRFGKIPKELNLLYYLTRLKIFGTRHEFTLFKFTDKILHAEKKLDKKSISKRIFLPPGLTAEEFEKHIKRSLSKEFAL